MSRWACLGIYLANLSRRVHNPKATFPQAVSGRYIEAAVNTTSFGLSIAHLKYFHPIAQHHHGDLCVLRERIFPIYQSSSRPWSIYLCLCIWLHMSWYVFRLFCFPLSGVLTSTYPYRYQFDDRRPLPLPILSRRTFNFCPYHHAQRHSSFGVNIFLPIVNIRNVHYPPLRSSLSDAC